MAQQGCTRFNAKPASRFGVLLAALAVAVQALIVQPHVDPAFAPRDVVASHASAPTAQAGPAQNQSTACLICQQLALAGAMTLSAPPSVALAAMLSLDATPLLHAPATRTFPAHPWLSRGPPSI